MEIGRGAEALVEFREGKVFKTRIKKGYRETGLDEKIRKERTRKEARIMEKAGRVIKVPKVIVTEGPFTLVMEYLKGTKVRDMNRIDDSPGGVAEKIGVAVGRLHAGGIAHQDLTTSNMIIRDGEVYLIDFGLADRGRLEDFAVDLRVLREALTATHGEEAWTGVARGYRKGNPGWQAVMDRLVGVDRRGRYKIRQTPALSGMPKRANDAPDSPELSSVGCRLRHKQ
ncbi:MAG TPA: Kae1-associated serine/threonine protein kinase [archaeon]|nr:Kae1-associated serine/threonine protein kinase [archaeon]